MPEVSGQHWHHDIDVDAGAKPVDNRSDGKGMTKAVQEWVHVCGAQTQFGGHLDEGTSHAAGGERSCGIRDEEGA